MNNELPLKQIIDAALSRIGSVADVNTVVGEPLAVGDGVTIIPFSKVSVGFASGGVDFDGKNKKEGDDPHFAGGNGAGVSVVPLGFLVIDGTEVRLLDLKHPEACAPRPQDPVNQGHRRHQRHRRPRAGFGRENQGPVLEGPRFG